MSISEVPNPSIFGDCKFSDIFSRTHRRFFPGGFEKKYYHRVQEKPDESSSNQGSLISPGFFTIEEGSIATALLLFPSQAEELKLKKRRDRAEALLLAEFIRKKLSSMA